MNSSDNGIEPAITVEPEANLNATSTGQLATSLVGKIVPELTRERAEKLAATRPHLDAKRLRAMMATRLGISLESIVDHRIPLVSKLCEIQRNGYSIETISLKTEPGITIPALIFVPSTGPRKKPAILYANAAGKSADAVPGGAIETLVRSGNIVIAPDLRGWGKSASLGGRPPDTGRYETTMRAFIVGKTMVGMQVVDMSRVMDYLISGKDVDRKHITLIGTGNRGVVALFAAALDSRFSKIVCEDELTSYVDMASTAYYDRSLFDVVVPGVLKDFDLPDVAAAIAPRNLQLIDTRSASRALEPLSQTRGEYAPTTRAYSALHRGSQFRILSRTAAVTSPE